MIARAGRRPDAPARPHAVHRLSVFDLDRTLTRRPTYSAFLLFAMRERAPWRMLLLPLLAPVALAYALGLIPRRRIKEAMQALALGYRVPAPALARLADGFARRLAERGLYPEGMALVRAEQASGRRVILATAAPRFYTLAIARALGIGEVVATDAESCDDAVRARIRGENCYGAAKRRMLAAYLARAGIARSAAHIRFYSDHASDLPTFDYCDEAIAVNPSPKLQALARQRGWAICDWRGAQPAPAMAMA